MPSPLHQAVPIYSPPNANRLSVFHTRAVKVGDTLIDTLTVTNHGPHQATAE